eukprot:TRINITY_DN12511_c0_g1_i8.p1 TRINITY_DN12511_c0_g1~~TRINITY_DN12511_c0_g1_i8.p1  ORF type:complete len:153 (+),score=38.72 TRINITY_DN12511_c0_g1_i8:448-906(+)
MAKDCKVLGELNFRWLKDVRGDGNCYYRAVMCGYIETLLTERPEYIEAYLAMIKKGNKVFSFEEEEERKARKLMLPVVERVAKIRSTLGIQKALQEYFLDSLSSDHLNSVWAFPIARAACCCCRAPWPECCCRSIPLRICANCSESNCKTSP